MIVCGGAARADLLFYDTMLKFQHRPTPSDLLVVAIDDRSLQAIGKWPWKRSVHAALLEQLAEHQPAATIYDVLFIEAQPGEDEALASAMLAAPVYLPQLVTTPGANGAPYQIQSPAPVIAAAAAGLGQVNLHPDQDGIVRRAWLAEVGPDGEGIPHLMDVVARRLGPSARPQPPAYPRSQSFRRAEPVLIPFGGGAGWVRTVSAVDLVRGQVPAAFLKNKVILVGATAAGLGDRFPTPEGDMPGVELHAVLLDGLLRGETTSPAGGLAVWLFSLVPVTVVLGAFIYLRPGVNAWLGAALILLVPAISAAVLLAGRVWLPPGAAMAGLVIAYPIWGWRRLAASSAYMIEELDRLRQEPAPLNPVPPLAGRGDVVERQVALMQQALSQMRDLRRFVSDALRELPDATLVVRPDGHVAMASATSDRLRASIGQPRLDRIEPVFAALAARDEIGAPLTLGDPRSREVVAPDGACYGVDQAPIVGHDGRGLGWVIRFSDQTAIRTAQAQREEALQLLSHDMRAPQASILALLVDSGQSAEPGVLQRVRALARRTLAMADGFVHLARAESAPLDLRPVDLGDLLLEVIDEHWPLASSKGVAVHAGGGDTELVAELDRSLLYRAISNLICNAIQHTPPGRGVFCSVAECGDSAQLVVADEGAGLSPEAAARLFGKFHSSRSGEGGVGLGLALVLVAAKRHGGSVVADATPEGGARFTLTLPMAASAPLAG